MSALGKAVVQGKVQISRAFDIWDELLLLPIHQVPIGSIPQLLQLAVKQDPVALRLVLSASGTGL